MSGTYLECAGLAKRYRDVLAVDGVDLEVERGHAVALLGPSGCGKTTLLRLIAGFEVPEAGSVRLGERILTAPGAFIKPELRRVGMVFQDFALFPHLSVASNIAFGMSAGGNRHARVEALLMLVGLPALADRMPHELSGGQQQRVALARSLAAEPDLILLDEPFSNLDPGMRQRVRADVRSILESIGATAIFVTHDQEEALSLAERVAVMLDGRIRQVGRPTEVYRAPADRDVARFLGEANFLRGTSKAGVVECELGLIAAGAAGAGSVEVMVRPESLALSERSGTPAHVISQEYYGHDRVITVRLSSGSLLKVRDTPGHEFAAGHQVAVSLRGDVVVFPEV